MPPCALHAAGRSACTLATIFWHAAINSHWSACSRGVWLRLRPDQLRSDGDEHCTHTSYSALDGPEQWNESDIKRKPKITVARP